MNGLDFGTAIGLIKGLGSPDPAVIESAVSDWLDDHPEATTTVQDGSITKAKLDSNLQGTVDDVANLKSQITGKVDVAQGVENAGKALVVGADGNVAPGDMSGGDVTTEQWLYSFPTDTVSGGVASFSDGGNNLPVKGLVIGIEPVQSAGTPTPETPLPISGWTGANINANGTTIPITFPSEAGTVYGGTLDVTTGVLTVDKNIITLRGDFSKHPTLENSFYQNNVLNDCAAGKCVSNLFAYSTIAFSSMPSGCFTIDRDYTRVVIRTNDDMTASEFNAMLSSNPLTIVYPLAIPQIYQLDPIEVLTLMGANTIYADTGNTTVTYRADPTLYADKRSTATRSIIAGIEQTMTASKAYTTGQLLIVGDTLYKVAASIASGATLTPGTNVNPTTVAEQLILLANA